MALTTYTAGEVLTAASLNANLSFAAANPPASIAGLELISTTTIGTTVSSVAVTSCFSATFDVYKVTISGGAVASTDAEIRLQLGSSTTQYFGGQISLDFSTNAVQGRGIANAASFTFAGQGNENRVMFNVDIVDPFITARTMVSCLSNFQNAANGYATMTGEHRSATSHTGFTISPSTGTITGGSIRVYGYKN